MDANRFTFLSRDELATLPQPKYLVNRMLPAKGTVLFYGESGIGKTFLEISLSCAVASGGDFFGCETTQGVAVLLAGEGYHGIPNRISTWEKRYQQKIAATSLYVTDDRPNLANAEEVTNLIAALKAKGIKPSIICVDTLATHFPGGNENEAKDVGAFLEGARQLSEAFECLVLIVHHTIKDGSNYRGSYALKGNVDTLIRVEKSNLGITSIICEKQRDFAEFEPLFFTLEQVVFADESGAEQTSLVVVEVEEPSPDSMLGKKRPLTDHDKKIISALEAHGPMSRKQLVDVTGVPEGSIDKLLKSLKLGGHVVKDGGKRGLWSLAPAKNP